MIGVAIAAGIACTAQSGVHEKPGKTQASVTAWGVLSPGPFGADKIPGYRHTIANSKFWLGQKGVAPRVENNGVYTRYIGTDGVFGVLPNGFAAGAPNANGPSTRVGPYSSEPTAHTALVLSYFIAGGIPQDQLDTPSLTTQMRSLAHTSDGKEIERQHLGYTTILHRKVAGCPVPDSHAWARFNKNGDVMAEQVWWPDLPGSLAADADAFRSMLANPTLAAAFRSKLPASLADKQGTVTIHHGSAFGEFWRAWVGYDIMDNYENKSFDMNGNKVSLASWNAAQSGTKTP